MFTNGGGEDTRGIGGNPFICQACDGPREVILLKLREMRAQHDRYWWFDRRAQRGGL